MKEYELKEFFIELNLDRYVLGIKDRSVKSWRHDVFHKLPNDSNMFPHHFQYFSLTRGFLQCHLDIINDLIDKALKGTKLTTESINYKSNVLLPDILIKIV